MRMARRLCQTRYSRLVTMRWPARSAITWIIRGDEPAAPTHGGTDHGRAYTHRPGRAQRDHRGGRAATGDGRVRRARDPEHARGAAPAVVSLPGRRGAAHLLRSWADRL